MWNKKYKNRIVFLLTIFLLKSNLLAAYIFTVKKAFQYGRFRLFVDSDKAKIYLENIM